MEIVPSFEEIRRGDTTDVYFPRTMQVLRAIGRDRVRVRAEGFVKKFPDRYGYAVLSGMDEMLSLLEGRAVDVKAMEEGSLFFPGEPVFAVEGPYGEFCEMETAMLGVLCQASGIATKAARLKSLAGEKTLLSFGARRMHPALSTMIDRNAWIGGADGVSAVRSADYLGIRAMGTMPHALALVVGDTVEAMLAFDGALDPSVPRVCLIDTLQDEKFEALRVAEALRGRLDAVRLDTPSSRRGDMRALLAEVRWELDLRGHSRVKLFVSGGLGEDDVAALAGVADGFGVGTALSNAPTIDFALDIVEVDGVPFAKRGKLSGAKQVIRCAECDVRKIVPDALASSKSCACGSEPELLLGEAMRDGRRLAPCLPPAEIRERVLERVRLHHSQEERD